MPPENAAECTVFEFTDIARVHEQIDPIRARVDEAGFAIIRGIVTPGQVDGMLKELAARFDPAKDVRISGAYKKDSPDFQRLDLGEYFASSRFARYFIYFPWNDNRTFEKIHELQISLFNRLSRKRDSYGSLEEMAANPDRYRMSYVIQYPIGGGFMSKHRENPKEAGDRDYVVYLALTTRGKAFQAGGAYVHVGDRKIDVEGYVRAGDLVLYRGDRDHGVEGVDRDQPVRLDKICGRLMMTSVIRYLGT